MNYYENLKEKKISVFLCKSRERRSHSHVFLELAYVLKGRALHKWDNTSFEIKEGDYFVIDYESKHSYQDMSEDFELINCLFHPEFIDSSFTSCHSLQTLLTSYQIRFNKDFFTASPSFYVFRDDDGRAKKILLDMLREADTQAPGYLQIMRSKIIELLVITMRKIYYSPSLEKENGQMSSMLSYINTHYSENITLTDLCKSFGYSFSYLSAKFKKDTGLNFTEYLQKTRIEQSMRLLSLTDLPIAVIASEVGYRDTKAFYSVFRRIAGSTPAKFRKNHRIDTRNA